jgi:hypothetical protein
MEERNGAGMAYAAGFLGRVLIERGDLDGARAALMSCPQPTPGSDGEAVVRGTTVELLLAERDWTRALVEAELHREGLGDVDNVAWAPWRSLKARALDGFERRDEARALLEDELVQARRWGATTSRASACRRAGRSASRWALPPTSRTCPGSWPSRPSSWIGPTCRRTCRAGLRADSHNYLLPSRRGRRPAHADARPASPRRSLDAVAHAQPPPRAGGLAGGGRSGDR